MNAKPLVAIALLVAAVGGVAVFSGDVLPGSDDAEAEPFPTATATATPTQATESGSSGEETPTSPTTPTATPPPFGFAIEHIEECGQTCRDVTSTLSNQQETTAEDVTVYSRIFAGQGTDGEEIWRGEEPVGTLGSGESYTTTRRVELSFSEALAVRNQDGWVTIQTTVETADRTVTFTDERQVI